MQTSSAGSGSVASSKYAESVSNAIIEAYYPRATAAADAARSRAQGAFAITSAIAGSLLGVRLFGDLTILSDLVKRTGSAALLCWLLTAVLYLRAVATPVRTVRTTLQDRDSFVDAVLDDARAERDVIDRRQTWATRAGLVAMGLTILAVVMALLRPDAQRLVPATVSLSSAGVATVEQVCASKQKVVEGSVDVASLGSHFVTIKTTPGKCQESTVELRIPSEQVTGIVRGR
jgi:hypothetical protein